MSKYLTAGWEKRNFIVTPEELEEVLKGMHFLVVNCHVPEGYRETPAGEYLADYARIYGALASGQQASYPVFSAIGVSASLEKHGYGMPHGVQGNRYLHQYFDEPCAMLQYIPLYVYKKADGSAQYTLSCSVTQFPQEILGLQLFFPKWIQYPCDGGYTQLASTKDLASYQSYLTVLQRIKSLTKPLRFVLDGREVRPNIRASVQARKDLANFWALRKYEIRVI